MSDTMDLSQERQYLERVLSQIDSQLTALRAEMEEQGKELGAVQEDFQEEEEQLLLNLWAADDFENLALLSQQMEQLTQQEQSRDLAKKRVDALERLADSPYFARVDLGFEEDEPPESIYIGRATLWDAGKRDILVHDWRSPIASVFYRFERGKAYYDAPAGRVCCELLRKLQYEIRRRQLQYCFEADTAIQDGVLRKMLGQNASPRMRSIVETIQRDQDLAIRDDNHDLLMVQGVAGSGKSAIALHRIAYLMYEGLKSRLTEHNILILSPNTLFEKYIGGVLPELGERNVATATLEQLLESLLGVSVQARSCRVEALCAASPEERERASQELAFKASPAFQRVLDRFVESLPRRGMDYRELIYAGKTLAAKEEIKDAVLRRERLFPLGVWLSRYERQMWERVRALRPGRLAALRVRAARIGRGEACARAYAIAETAALAGQLRAMTRLDCLGLYRRLISDAAEFGRLAAGISLPQGWERLLSSGTALPDAEALSLADAAAVAYLKLRLFGTSLGRDIRQVVVDEAQDYGPMDYAVLGLMFPKARFTVLGDVNQALELPRSAGFYEDVRAALNRPSAVLMELNKSFRCTREILEFSRHFLSDSAIESFNRPGEPPRLLPDGKIVEEIARCRKAGYKSIALIAKTAAEAAAWSSRLAAETPVSLMGRDTYPGDAFVIPLALSKGLEFDAVLVLDCDAAHYGLPGDARLLYVACTRALHHLALFARENFSPLVPEKSLGE